MGIRSGWISLIISGGSGSGAFSSSRAAGLAAPYLCLRRNSRSSRLTAAKHLTPMPFHDHGLIPGLDRVGNLLEVDSKMGRAHIGFSHPPTLPPGSDISGPEKKKNNFFSDRARGLRWPGERPRQWRMHRY